MVLYMCLIGCIPEVCFAFFSFCLAVRTLVCWGDLLSGLAQAHCPANGVSETRPLSGAGGHGGACASGVCCVVALYYLWQRNCRLSDTHLKLFFHLSKNIACILKTIKKY